MRGRKNPPLDLTPVPDGTPLTFDTMAQAYLEDYVLQRYRTLSTARARVEHLRGFLRRLGRRGDHGRQRAQLPVTPTKARRGGRDDQSRDVGAQPHVSVGDPPGTARAHAAVPQSTGGESAARRLL